MTKTPQPIRRRYTISKAGDTVWNDHFSSAATVIWNQHAYMVPIKARRKKPCIKGNVELNKQEINFFFILFLNINKKKLKIFAQRNRRG